MSIPRSHPHGPQPGGADPLHAAAVEAVEVAVCAFVEHADEVVLAYVMRCARRHLSLDEMRTASGFDEAFITRLLQKAA